MANLSDQTAAKVGNLRQIQARRCDKSVLDSNRRRAWNEIIKRQSLCSNVFWREEMKTVKPHILYVSVILAIITFIFWVATFFVIYVADDRQSPAADERSIPAPRTY
jgi:hypothetical protein